MNGRCFLPDQHGSSGERVTYDLGVVKDLHVLGLGPLKDLGHTVELGFLLVSTGSRQGGDTYNSLEALGNANGVVESSLGGISSISRRDWLELVCIISTCPEDG